MRRSFDGQAVDDVEEAAVDVGEVVVDVGDGERGDGCNRHLPSNPNSASDHFGVRARVSHICPHHSFGADLARGCKRIAIDYNAILCN